MKKIVAILAILTGVSFAGTVNAGPEGGAKKEVKLLALGDTRFRLAFENSDGRSQFSIKDELGEVLYTESVAKSSQYMKIFDFSTLRDGKYSFVVVSGKQKVEKPFEISTSVKRVIVAAE